MDQPTDEKNQKAQREIIAQFLIAEHSALATERSGTIFESTGRVTLYLTTLSGTLVALGFIAQITEMGESFFAFCLILLPVLVFIGIVTFDRVIDNAIEDGIGARGMARIRHFFTEEAPLLEQYLVMGTHDDSRALLENMGKEPSRWQIFLTTAGMVSVVNSAIIGVLVGIVASRGATSVVAVLVGVVAFIISVAGHTWYQMRRWRMDDEKNPPRFPRENS